MKRLFINLTVIGLVALLITSCVKDVIENPVDEFDTFTVKLGLGGEFNIDYEEMTKASSDDLYGIQVYSTPDLEDESNLTPYAYGLFDNPAGIEITLLKGYRYKFVATLVRDGKNKIRSYDNEYSQPFFVNGTEYGHCELTNSFSYDATKKMSGLDKGNTTYEINRDYDRPNTDRFYGELEEFVPERNNTNAVITMKRVSYGAKFIAQGNLAKSGKIEVLMTGSPSFEFALTNNAEDDIYSDIYTFSNVYAAWNSTEENIYSEIVTTTVNWYREDGTVVPLGSHDITFKRNTNTIITIRINSDEVGTGIGLDIEEKPMTDGDRVTIEDGEMTHD